MPIDPTPTLPGTDQLIQQWKENNIQIALTRIRELSIHCVLYVPANDISEQALALIHRELTKLIKLYEPKAASL